MTETTITLLEWLKNPPTIVIYRPDGQLSLDQLPDMASPEAVVAFDSMDEAQRFLQTTTDQVGRSQKKKRKVSKFRPVDLPFDEWIEVMRCEGERGRTHISIFHLPGNGSLSKKSMRIADILNAIEYVRSIAAENRP